MLSFFERLDTYMIYKGLNDNKITLEAGISNGIIGKGRKRGSLSQDNISKILYTYPELNANWLLTGNGEMLKNNAPEESVLKRDNKIPFYDDVITVGGYVSEVADVATQYRTPAEWIDAGDWFHEATAAIRHYGDSMIEYPSGSILALKIVQDRHLLLWGRNYSIETSEFRVTKQIQPAEDGYIYGYSTNQEVYPDGRQIHAPIKIPLESIYRMFLVLGCVTKEYSSGPLQIRGNGQK